MPTEKKDPIIVDGSPLYTLSSYEPVSVVVATRDITEGDVDAAVWGYVMSEHGTIANMLDDEWIRETFPKFSGLEEFRKDCRERLQEMNENMLEERTTKECANALAERLEQWVLRSEVDSTRMKMQQSLLEFLGENDLTMAEFMSKERKSEEDINKWFDVMSIVTAKQMAALDAFARGRGINVSVDEIRAVVKEGIGEEYEAKGISVDEAMRQIIAQGQMPSIRYHATIVKAMNVVRSEAKITYDSNKELDQYDPVNGYPSIVFF